MNAFLSFLQKHFSPITLSNIAMLLTVIFWGSSYINTKIILTEMAPSTLAFCRFFIASFIMIFLLKKIEPAVKLAKNDYIAFFIAGFLGIALYFFLENTGIKYTTAANASLIASFAPILSIALNMIFFKGRLSLCETVGIIAGIGGAYLTITANGAIDITSDHFKGNMLMIGAMIAWAAYTLYSKKLQSHYSGLAALTYQTIFATTALLPLALTEAATWHAISLSAFSQLIYLATLCSVAGYLFYLYSLKTLDVVITTLYLNLVPIIGVICGYVILDETILPIQLIGGMLIIAAIVIANLPKFLSFQKQSKPHTM